MSVPVHLSFLVTQAGHRASSGSRQAKPVDLRCARLQPNRSAAPRGAPAKLGLGDTGSNVIEFPLEGECWFVGVPSCCSLV